MKPIYFMMLSLLLLFALGVWLRRRDTMAAAIHHIRKTREERSTMEAFAKQFIGKECIIYTITSNDGTIQGTIKEVSAGGILLEDAQGQMQVVNLEYVTRLREYPRNKKGKKKSVIMD